MMVTTLSRLKQQVRWPYPRLCASLGLSYATFRRWQHRLEHGQPAFCKPGPHKVAPLNLEELHVALCHLQHGRQRSRGAGRLYRQYQNQISRRDLQVLTDTMRRELAHQHQAELHHITWRVPGLVWSLDDAELARCAHHKLYLHQVQDLASRYKFTPWVGEQVLGETVAVHLEQLFLQHGPPLVLKRDNGSNLNQQAVDEVLARYLVMPLNSPPHYPPYNGGMECAVRELKTPLVEKILARGPPSESQVQAWAEVLAHELNHRSRGCLARARRLPGLSGCEARPAGVYSPQAKGDLRLDQRTDHRRLSRSRRFTLNAKSKPPDVGRWKLGYKKTE